MREQILLGAYSQVCTRHVVCSASLGPRSPRRTASPRRHPRSGAASGTTVSVPSHAGREAPTTPQGWDDEAAKLLLIDPHLFDVYADRGCLDPKIPWIGSRGLAVLGIKYAETHTTNSAESVAFAKACFRMRCAIRKETQVNQIYGEING